MAESSPTSLPFRLDRHGGGGLSEQIAAGLRGAMRSGTYRPGDRLPAIRAMARSLETSNLMVNRAVQQLASEGWLMARPRTGIHVLESHERVWRAHVLLVGGTAESHYFAQRQATFSHLLEAANVRVTTVHYLRDARADVDRIRAASDGMNVSHALLEVDHCDPLVVATLLDTGLPIVACTSGEAWPNARQPATLIDLNAEAAVVELAEHLVDIGRPLVGIQAVTRESSEALADTLAGHGLDTLVLDNRYPAIGTDCSRVASLEESGYRTVHQLILGGDLPGRCSWRTTTSPAAGTPRCWRVAWRCRATSSWSSGRTATTRSRGRRRSLGSRTTPPSTGGRSPGRCSRRSTAARSSPPFIRSTPCSSPARRPASSRAIRPSPLSLPALWVLLFPMFPMRRTPHSIALARTARFLVLGLVTASAHAASGGEPVVSTAGTPGATTEVTSFPALAGSAFSNPLPADGETQTAVLEVEALGSIPAHTLYVSLSLQPADPEAGLAAPDPAAGSFQQQLPDSDRFGFQGQNVDGIGVDGYCLVFFPKSSWATQPADASGLGSGAALGVTVVERAASFGNADFAFVVRDGEDFYYAPGFAGNGSTTLDGIDRVEFFPLDPTAPLFDNPQMSPNAGIRVEGAMFEAVNGVGVLMKLHRDAGSSGSYANLMTNFTFTLGGGAAGAEATPAPVEQPADPQ